MIDFTQVIKLDSNHAPAYLRRGMMFDEIGEHQKAIDDFDTAIRINPNFAEAYQNRGCAYHKIGHPPYAISDLQKSANLYKEQGRDKNFQEVVDILREIHRLQHLM